MRFKNIFFSLFIFTAFIFNFKANVLAESINDAFIIQQEHAVDNHNLLLNNLEAELYGGSFINDEGNLVVLLLKGKEDLAKQAISKINGIVLENIKYQLSEFSKKDLNDTYDFLQNHMEELPIQGLYTDVINNTINIHTNLNNKKNTTDINTLNTLITNLKLKENINIDTIKFDYTFETPQLLIGEDVLDKKETKLITFDDRVSLNNQINTSSIAFGTSSYVYGAAHAFNNNDIII